MRHLSWIVLLVVLVLHAEAAAYYQANEAPGPLSGTLTQAAEVVR